MDFYGNEIFYHWHGFTNGKRTTSRNWFMKNTIMNKYLLISFLLFLPFFFKFHGLIGRRNRKATSPFLSP